MVDLKFTPHIEILSAEDVPRRRHWSDADNKRFDAVGGAAVILRIVHQRCNMPALGYYADLDGA